MVAETPVFAPPMVGSPFPGTQTPSNVTALVPASSAFDLHAMEWFDKGWEPVPTPYGLKAPFPLGVTGAAGVAFTEDELTTLVKGELTYERPDHIKGPTFVARWEPNRNLCLRLGPGVVGIDVDAYEGKTGARTLAELEQRAGSKLPDTYVITSRDDQISGIRLYRVDDGVKLADQVDVEMIQRHHRVCVAPGSVHKSGRIYKLLRSGDWTEVAHIPTPDMLTKLPKAWVKVLSARADKQDFNTITELSGDLVRVWIGEHTANDGRWTAEQAAAEYDRVWGYTGARNTTLFRALWTSLLKAADGQCGADEVIRWVTAAHERACADDASRTARISEEVTRAVSRIISKIITEPLTTDDSRPEVNVSNEAIATDWLSQNVGLGRLAGMMARDGRIVHTPQLGEDGYVNTGDADRGEYDGPAQIRALDAGSLTAKLQFAFKPYRVDNSGEAKRSIFPLIASQLVVNAIEECPNLQPLKAVTHTPVVRPDGSILNEPGYDPVTGYLYLPQAGRGVPLVPVEPTPDEMANAVGWIEAMIGQFPFVTPHDKAHMVCYLLTPLIRMLTPPPYKLFVFTARQKGSGKTLLSTLGHIIHGGVFRSSFPEDEAETAKEVTTILTTDTAPVVTFDNVTGTLRSRHLTALLTSPVWSQRLLGGNTQARAANDRVWSITGNNAALGGDFSRRALWIDIDAGCPDPHKRTGFAVTDLAGWAEEHRPEILWALLTLVRGWMASGSPVGAASGSDGYERWLSISGGIIRHAGYAGTVGYLDEAVKDSTDEQDWSALLEAIHEAMGDQPWTVGELLAATQLGHDHHVPAEMLPTDVMDKLIRPMSAAKTMGLWLRNRRGTWAGQYAVQEAGVVHKTKTWRVIKFQG